MHCLSLRHFSVSVVLLSLLPWTAFAQEQDIEEIIVSVRKTDENLQEIPVAVSVLDQEFIDKEAVRTLDDVALQTPSLQFDQGFWPSDTRISIRGLFARAGRPSAAVLIDGIDAMSESLQSSGGSALLNQRLLDLERIEVARGPQSALYGRGAFAGAINYVTKRPEAEWGATLNADAGQDGRYELQGIFQGPITDDLAFGLVLSHYELDGYYENNITGDDIGGGESEGIGFSLNWTPSDNFSAYWNTTYSDDDFDPQAVVAVRSDSLRSIGTDASTLIKNYAGPGCAPGTICNPVVTGTIKARERDINLTPNPRSFNVDAVPDDPENGKDFPGTEDETWRSNLILDWDMGWANLRSSTSYTDAENRIRFDTTNYQGIVPFDEILSPETAPPALLGIYFDPDYTFEFEQYYQEFQLSNSDDAKFDWLVGVNAFYEEATDHNQTALWYRDDGACPFPGAVCDYLPTSPNPAIPFDKTQERDTTSLSMFGLLGFDLTDSLTLTLEGRVIYDKIEIEGSTADQLADIASAFETDYRGTPGWEGDVDDTNFVPRVSLEWQAQDNMMFYTSVAKGIKPPTYNTTDIYDPEIAEVDKEELWTYEIGAKTQWLENRLTANVAIYYNDYTDQQVRVQDEAKEGFTTPASGAANAGDVDVYGLEFDSNWFITEHWQAGLNYAYNDGEYDEFDLGKAQAKRNQNLSVSEQVKAGTGLGTADYSGNTLPGIPEHALGLFGQYANNISADLEWYTQATWQWQDERYADTANLVTLDDYSVVNAQIGLQTDTWFVAFYAENLFDDDTVRFAQEFIDQPEGFRLDLSGSGVDADGNTVNSFGAFPIAYFAYLPQPQTFGVRFQYRIQ